MTTAIDAHFGICPNFIGGEVVQSLSGRAIERRNPANLKDLLGYTPLSGRDEVRSAIDAARRAFPAWRNTPAPTRGRILMRLARIMEDRKEEIARLLTREEGKALPEAIGEMNRSINCVEFAAGEARRLTGETLPSELPRNFAYTLRVPLGVVGIITPWNFPAAIPCWKIAPALTCGNTVVWKPSELTPFTSRLLMEMFVDAGVPAGVLNLVHGTGDEAGDELVEHDAVKAISFTGSCEVGALLYAKGARKMKKIQCEMGGKNPVIVLQDADLEFAADGVVSGAFGSSGQRCTATSRVIAVESIADRFVDLVRQRAEALRVGNGMEPGVQVGPSVDEPQFKKVQSYLEIGKTEGTLVCGGHRLTGAPWDDGYFIAPTVFDRVPATARIAQEEIFGPVLSIIRVQDADEAIEAANGIRFGLAASIYTRDANRVFDFADRIECGIAHVNSATVGGEAHVPFGGIKATGIGDRETGSTAIDFYSEIKVVYVDYSRG